MSMYAEMHATLRNVSLQMGLRPPTGKVWTGAMLLPGYEAPQELRKTTAQKRREIFRKAPSKEEVRAARLRSNEYADRVKRAKAMKKSGAPSEQIRAVMEGRE